MRRAMNSWSRESGELADRAAARGGIDGRQRLGGIPVHERQIMIRGIFAVSDQCGERIPAIFERQTLERRSQVKTDDRRRVFAPAR